MSNIVESDEELVVKSLGIVEESTDYGLYGVDAFFIEVWAERKFSGLLDSGAIYDGSVPVRGKLAFLGVRMIPFQA